MYVFIILFIIFAAVYTQVFKFALQTAKDYAVMTILMEIISAGLVALFIPLFDWRLPTDWSPVILLVIASIFYGVSSRINTTVRSGIEASTYLIIKQLSAVFMVIFGFLFLGEALILWKILGAILIITGNIIVFWKPHQKINKYFLMGVGSSVLFAVALFFDVNVSGQFNLPFYLFAGFTISAITVALSCRVSPQKIIAEVKQNKRIRYMVIVGSSSAGMMLTQLLAYQASEVSVVAPLLATSVLANVFVGYIALKERDHLPRKILAAVLVVIGVILIRLAG
jgi:drug/metabolite transporter (DMT)-like permease